MSELVPLILVASSSIAFSLWSRAALLFVQTSSATIFSSTAALAASS